MQLINDLNLKKQAEELGIKVWQTPGFLFIVMGFVAVIIMTATYYVSENYDNPQAIVISESLAVSLVLIIGNGVIRIIDQMVRLNKLKNEFISVASHQLRTPVSAIKWETELLLTKYKKGLSEKQLKNIETIGVLSHRMIRLVNDLLDVVRIDQKRLVLKKVSIDLTLIVEECISDFLAVAKARNIEIIFLKGKKPIKILGDPERLKMVVENLLNNAVKYTTNKGKIEIKIGKKEKMMLFSIKDNGVGIPEDQQNRIFEKFFRSDNAVKYQTEGTGLGLYIAKNIIEQSGGRIWFQSVENLGTVFNFTLPIK